MPTRNAATRNNNIISKLAQLMFMLILVITCVFLAIQVRTSSINQHKVNAENTIFCITSNHCAIKVDTVWYRVTGVIDLSETTPEEYKSAIKKQIIGQIGSGALNKK